MSYRDIGLVLLGAGIVIVLTPVVIFWMGIVTRWLTTARQKLAWRGYARRAARRRRQELAEQDKRGKRGANTYGDTPEG